MNRRRFHMSQSRVGDWNIDQMQELERRHPRDGRFIERVGFYDPKAPEGREGLRVDLERVKHWTGQGAQLSPTALRLVKQFGKKAA